MHRSMYSKKNPLQKFLFIFLLAALPILIFGCKSASLQRIENKISGYIKIENEPVENVLVRQQATENKTMSDQKGYFELIGFEPDQPVIITAWLDSYYVGWIETIPSNQPVTIQLTKHYQTDNPDYDWFSHEGELGSLSCSHCMPSYYEWKKDAHAQSAINPRFLTMYNGTDLYGNQSPPTVFGYNRDYGTTPLIPNDELGYYGPGYKLDFPDSAGNCAACHVPGMAAYPGQEYTSDPNLAEGINQEGVFCEFCHKIGDVTLNPETQLPYRNMPGVLSYQLNRPDGDQQLFYGNFDDVNRRVTYLPLIEESAYCAPCHSANFWDVQIYDSYGEWLASPYSNPDTGQTCQNCHMPPVDYDYFVYPEKGGLTRDSTRIYSHTMPGAMDQEFLQNAVEMQANGNFTNNSLQVNVTLTNDNTGHDIPTDYPLRQMILVVSALDAGGNELSLISGPVIPDYGGIGNPEEGYYAGLPGKVYMKVLREIWTGVYPSGAYWNPTEVLTDNRLSPDETDQMTFFFEPAGIQTAQVHIRLLFRRATKELTDQKGWDVPDILMKEIILDINN